MHKIIDSSFDFKLFLGDTFPIFAYGTYSLKDYTY
jgi:hypothetical protein